MALKVLTLFTLAILSHSVGAASPKLIREGSCTRDGARVVFDGIGAKTFASKNGYKCSGLKVSENQLYACWRSDGKISSEHKGTKSTYPDAVLWVATDGKSYPLTENSRFIPNWFYVPNKNEVVVETAFEHGPSTYFLYDLETRKKKESCQESELDRCKDLAQLVEDQKSK
ncbi:MAG: hypothetical protein K2X47_09685 [Bdellovibrionales bacterium]|nr:hypothetical protein [Bdellovibrionales bacterium]